MKVKDCSANDVVRQMWTLGDKLIAGYFLMIRNNGESDKGYNVVNLASNRIANLNLESDVVVLYNLNNLPQPDEVGQI